VAESLSGPEGACEIVIACPNYFQFIYASGTEHMRQIKSARASF
jgi:hypothetical protein